MGEHEDWMSKTQGWFTGSGIVAALFMFALEIPYISSIVGESLTVVRFYLLIAAGICFIAGSVKTLQMFSRFTKIMGNIKKGKTEEED